MRRKKRDRGMQKEKKGVERKARRRGTRGGSETDGEGRQNGKIK